MRPTAVSGKALVALASMTGPPVGCAPSYMHTILKRAAEAEAGAKAPVRVGLQRTAREALEAIINDRDAKHSDVVAAARALDALKAEPLDGEDAARPTALVVSGPVVCPECGHDLRPVRQAELEAKLARFSEIPGNNTPPGNQDDPRF